MIIVLQLGHYKELISSVKIIVFCFVLYCMGLGLQFYDSTICIQHLPTMRRRCTLDIRVL